MLKKCICTALIILLIPALYSNAVPLENAYTYNAQQEAVLVPAPYSVKKIAWRELQLKEPRDLMVSGDFVYILDSGNSRIVVTDSLYNFHKEIKFKKNGGEYPTQELTGIWIDGETILIADKSAECVFRIDFAGNVLHEYTAPKNNASETEKNFLPLRVVTDATGYLYILLENEYRGMMVLTPQGDFVNYYGSAKVQISAQLLSDLFWRNFMTEEQIASSSRYVPGGYNDITVSPQGFIYAAKGISSVKSEMLCKLNSAGKNILAYKGSFGDRVPGKSSPTVFIGLAVDDDGFISAIDSAGKRIFHYTPDGELLYIFGGEGEQECGFSNPAAIEARGGDLLVLDEETGCLTVLQKNEFAELVQKAVFLYRQAKFNEAADIWKKVLLLHDGYEAAYMGLGKIAEANKDYAEALKNYRLGGSKINYSSAFYKQRMKILRGAFNWLAPLLIFLIIGIFVLVRALRKRRDKAVKAEHLSKLSYAFYSLFHPFDAFSELRYNKHGSVITGAAILLLWFFVSCLNYNYNGYIFNNEYPQDFNMLIILASTVGIAVLFVLCNWLLTTFFEGKGSLPQIWTGVCYSLIPVTAGGVLELLFSNILTFQEAFFLTALKTVCLLWTLALVFIATKGINQYGFRRNAVSIIFSVLAMLAIVFLAVLFFNLWTQLVSFISVVYREIAYRIQAS